MQAVIMAGGKGTRLGVLTKDTPKPLVPVNEKPILLYQIEGLKENGVGYLGEQIREYFGDGSRFSVRIDYVVEEQPLGTAGNFPLLRDYVEGDFVLLYGDLMLDIDWGRFLAFHQGKGALVSLFAHSNSHPFDSDLIEVDSSGRVTGYLPKNQPRGDYHNLVNAGAYICRPEVLSYVPSPTKMDFEKDLLFSKMLEDGVYAYRSSEYVKDAGTLERLEKVSQNERDGVIRQRNLRNRQKCIFLDRDGTINKFRGLITAPHEIELEDGAAEAIKLINDSPYLCIVVTNQPVVARGLCTEADVDRLHKRLETLLGNEGAYLDDILYCPHHPDKGYEGERPEYKIDCDCRKPKTGMIERCVKRYNIDLSASYIIGDSTIDIQTGANAGLKTALLKTGLAGTDGKFDVYPNATYSTLLEAVKAILG